jgi:hypothetical protein
MLTTLSLRLIAFYRNRLGEYFGGHCRFTPTCSEYAYLAIEQYGFAAGWFRALKRLLRCRPPYGGIDYP